MANFNKVVLIGNMTRDPELRYLPSNTAVCQFGLAINHKYRDKEGNQKEEVCFIDCTCFGKGGEIINQYMAKGRPLLVEGRLRLESWMGQDGQKRSRHSVFVENFQFLGGGRGDDNAGGGAPAARSAPVQRSGAPSGGARRDAAPAAHDNSMAYDDQPPMPKEEDIPF